MKKTIHYLALFGFLFSLLSINPLMSRAENAESTNEVCGGKIAVSTMEGLITEDLNKYADKYEQGFIKTSCTKTAKATAEGPSKEYVLSDCHSYQVKSCSVAGNEDTSGTLTTCQPVYFVCGNSGAELLKNYIKVIYVWGTGLGSLVSVLIIIASGIQISAANGDSSKIEEAKTRIMTSLAGLVLLFLAALFLYTINPTFFINAPINAP